NTVAGQNITVNNLTSNKNAVNLTATGAITQTANSKIFAGAAMNITAGTGITIGAAAADQSGQVFNGNSTVKTTNGNLTMGAGSSITAGNAAKLTTGVIALTANTGATPQNVTVGSLTSVGAAQSINVNANGNVT